MIHTGYNGVTTMYFESLCFTCVQSFHNFYTDINKLVHNTTRRPISYREQNYFRFNITSIFFVMFYCVCRVLLYVL